MAIRCSPCRLLWLNAVSGVMPSLMRFRSLERRESVTDFNSGSFPATDSRFQQRACIDQKKKNEGQELKDLRLSPTSLSVFRGLFNMIDDIDRLRNHALFQPQPKRIQRPCEGGAALRIRRQRTNGFCTGRRLLCR